MTNLDDLHRDLKTQLQGLRDSIFSLQDDARYLGAFEEFLREREFGLALETLCDFLLEPTTPTVSSPLLKQIEDLHQLMSVKDACVQKLTDKASKSRAE